MQFYSYTALFVSLLLTVSARAGSGSDWREVKAPWGTTGQIDELVTDGEQLVAARVRSQGAKATEWLAILPEDASTWTKLGRALAPPPTKERIGPQLAVASGTLWLVDNGQLLASFDRGKSWLAMSAPAGVTAFAEVRETQRSIVIVGEREVYAASDAQGEWALAATAPGRIVKVLPWALGLVAEIAEDSGQRAWFAWSVMGKAFRPLVLDGLPDGGKTRGPVVAAGGGLILTSVPARKDDHLVQELYALGGRTWERFVTKSDLWEASAIRLASVIDESRYVLTDHKTLYSEPLWGSSLPTKCEMISQLAVTAGSLVVECVNAKGARRVFSAAAR